MPAGKEWHEAVWIMEPEADWNAQICPKPAVMQDTWSAYLYDAYINWRDRQLPPDAGGYADQSAKIMAIMGIISAWQSDHEAQLRKRHEERAAHHDKIKRMKGIK